MKKMLILFSYLTFQFSLGICSVYAQTESTCIYEGDRYPVGTRIGPYVCQPDGSWLRVERE